MEKQKKIFFKFFILDLEFFRKIIFRLKASTTSASTVIIYYLI